MKKINFLPLEMSEDAEHINCYRGSHNEKIPNLGPEKVTRRQFPRDLMDRVVLKSSPSGGWVIRL